MRIIKHLRARFGLLFRPYYAFRASRPVLSLLNKDSISRYQKNLPSSSSLQQKIIDDMLRFGISVTRIEELFPNKNILQELQENAMLLLKDAQPGRKKKFLRHAWGGNPKFDFSHPLIKTALDPTVLNIANGYFGLLSKLTFFSINATIPQVESMDQKGSQLWHRDPGIKSVFKMFIYLSDVLDEGAGPFIYVRESHEGGRWGRIFPQELSGRMGIYPPENAVEKRIPKDFIQTCLGSAGTVIFCDTLGLHKGGFSTTMPRIMTTILYEPPAALIKRKFIYSPEDIEVINRQNEAVRYALS